MFEITVYILGAIVIGMGFVVFFGAPYVPTLKPQIRKIFELHPLSSQDVFVDIGSGDGVVLRAAAKYGATTIGFELNPLLWAVSTILGWPNKRVTTRLANVWHQSLPDETTIVYTFLRDAYMKKLEQKLKAHVTRTRKPLILISYAFKIPDRKIIKQNEAMFVYKFKP